jgi:hypothetical protein
LYLLFPIYQYPGSKNKSQVISGLKPPNFIGSTAIEALEEISKGLKATQTMIFIVWQ